MSMNMKLNDDMTGRVIVDTVSTPWVESPTPGVRRRMLARHGGEQGLATSIVRYDPGARFPEHAHPEGEEIYVLSGCFEDEHGRYPAGTYLRNPHGSTHTPFSQTGCDLFVKLRQLPAHATRSVVAPPGPADWRPGLVPGLSVFSLDAQGPGHTALVRWSPDTRFQRHWHHGGEEILVLDGTFEDEHGRYPTGTWIRSPHMSTHEPFSREGCLILVKVGHLA
ncbi:cupin domain-containing protein [Nitrogeniibacter aestuarii]|uniref:cupin domain-containing protein n=1 Tax=Nitrogeniibacter aestuarii TaxID=2815343 RepID=UPI001E3FD597|nr:cupin domain-containing protein [Nitrogeniibacter aestuarii]